MILSFFHDTTGGIHILADTSWDGSDLMRWINHQQWKRNKRYSDQRKWNLFQSLLTIIPHGQSPNHGILDLPFTSVKSVAWSACVNRVAEKQGGVTRFLALHFSCQWLLSSFGVIWTLLPRPPSQVHPGTTWPSQSSNLQNIPNLQVSTKISLVLFPITSKSYTLLSVTLHSTN